MFDDIMDALGYVGSALDKPGRAVRGLLAGKFDEGLAAVPFSDSLGLTDPSRRTSGRELLGLGRDGDLGGDLAGFGAELATDPLTFAGAGLGRLVGGRASRAAEAMGPGYKTTAEDVGRMFQKFDAAQPELSMEAGSVGSRLSTLATSPNAGRLFSEIPEGSRILGGGGEAVAFATPQGDVLRLGKVTRDNLGLGRPVSDDIIQASRAVDIPTGKTGLTYRAERVPFAQVPDYLPAGPAAELERSLAGQGLSWADRASGNAGTLSGRPVIVDPGAVLRTDFKGKFSPVADAAEPSPLMRRLLDAMGGQQRTREAIAAGRAGPDLATELTLLGGGLGSVGGAFGRAGRY
jgi:hypothetical protein